LVGSGLGWLLSCRMIDGPVDPQVPTLHSTPGPSSILPRATLLMVLMLYPSRGVFPDSPGSSRDLKTSCFAFPFEDSSLLPGFFSFTCAVYYLKPLSPENTYLLWAKAAARRRWDFGRWFPKRVIATERPRGPTKIGRSRSSLFHSLPCFETATPSPSRSFYLSRSFPTTKLSPTFTNSECKSSAWSSNYVGRKPS
jgi:hypothetical protein